MLTHFRVCGFKNLYDVELAFGPFTCIAGSNGIGKSNLFDAIEFLSKLADDSFVEAASSLRGSSEEGGDVRSLFFTHGEYRAERLLFEAEIVIAKQGEDHLGQPAAASSTFLRYELELGLTTSAETGSHRMTLLRESLRPITLNDAPSRLPFAKGKKRWRDSILLKKRRGTNFISTTGDGPERKILLHQDGGSRGQPNSLLAARLPRTVLSSATATESPTALLARRELRSWKLLQLEPTSMRRPDKFTALDQSDAMSVGSDGSHIAAALYALAREERAREPAAEEDLYNQFGNRLATLVNDVRAVRVDKDDKRELLTVEVAGKDGTFHPARALSDGTLRFLTLAILERSGARDVICLEEPENGIHPSRVRAMLELLDDIAVDTGEAVSIDNPLRQVLVNTHSPGVVENVPVGSVLFADAVSVLTDEKIRIVTTRFAPLKGTWRGELSGSTKSLFDVLAYLRYAADVPRDPEFSVQTVGDALREQMSFGFGKSDVAADTPF